MAGNYGVRNRSLWDKIRSDSILPYILCIPTVLTLLAITIYPIFYSFYMSFNKWRLGGDEVEFVGLENYIRIFADSGFYSSLSRTLIYAFGTTIIAFILGVAIALLFSRDFWAAKFVRGLILMPMMVTPAVVGFMFIMIYNGDYGILNYTLKMLGVINNNIVWLGEPTLAFISAMTTDIWTMTPFITLLTVAGLQSLPKEPYESATVDGANSLQMFVYITLPLLKNILFVAFTLRLIIALRTFAKLYILTGGGPGGATELLSLRIQKIAMQYFQVGRASALNVVLVIVTLFFVLLLLLTRRWLEKY